MFCPGCGVQVSGDLKYCRQCGANLRGVQDVMTSRSEKFDWSKTWVADMFLTEEERERRQGITPEEKRLNEIKGGVITSFVGLGVMIFLYFLMDAIAMEKSPEKAVILHRIWLAGLIPFLVGLGIIFNGLFVSRGIVRIREAQGKREMPAESESQQIPAKTTDQLAAPPARSLSDASVTDDTTAHLPEAVLRSPRRNS